MTCYSFPCYTKKADFRPKLDKVQILRLKKYTYIQKMDAMKAFSLQKEKEEVMICGIFYFL